MTNILKNIFAEIAQWPAWKKASLLAAFSICIAWLAVGAYQSHYGSALSMLGDASHKPIFGTPKEGRADEWSTYLPLLKQAYLEHFPAQSVLAPYHERFDWFITIPHLDFSLLFLPNQVAYWVLPGGMALSFQGLYYNLLLILSCYWLLVNLRTRPAFAVPAVAMVLFSQFYQAWWTSNFPVLGALFLPLAVHTSSLRARWRVPLLAWSVAHLALGQMYPAFVLPMAMAVLPLAWGIRPEILNWRRIIPDVLAGFAGLAAYLAIKWPYILAVSKTVYPGQRVSLGGGSSPSTAISALFPTFPAHALPVPGAPVNELAMVGTVIPLIAFACMTTMRWDRVTIRVTCIVAVVAALMLAYMLVPFPEWLVKISALSLVPGRRMQLGLSMIVLLYSLFILSRHHQSIRAIPTLSCIGVYVICIAIKGVDPGTASQFAGYSLYAYVCGGLAVAGYVGSFFLRQFRPAANIVASVLAGMTIMHIVVFGSYNPIMRGNDILAPVDTQVVRDWKALYAKNGYRPFGIGNYGNVLRGEGLPALEAIHLANVDPGEYKILFPEVPSIPGDRLFNSFQGIGFSEDGPFRPESMPTDSKTLMLPMELHGVSLPHSVVYGDADAPSDLFEPPTGSVFARSDHGVDVYWRGVLNRPMPVDTHFTMQVSCRVFDSWMTRLPGMAPGATTTTEALQVMVGRMGVDSTELEKALACVRGMQVSADRHP